MIKYFTIALLLLPFYTFGQDIETYKYFINEDNELCDSASAVHILTISHKRGTTSGSAKVTSKDGLLISEVEYADFLKKIRHGESKDYNEYGKLRLKAFYKNNTLDGEFTTYYPNGVLKRSDFYKNDTLISGRCYTSQGKDTTYYKYFIPAEYIDGGINNLRKSIFENIKYPKKAKRNDIEGEVIVSFVVGKDGIAHDFKIKKSVHPLLDTEALRATSQMMGKWSPMYLDGELFSIKKFLPIKFELYNRRRKDKKE